MTEARCRTTPVRGARGTVCGATAASLVAIAVAVVATPAIAATPDLSGVWLATGPRQGVGEMPELTEKATADRAAFNPLDDPVLRCVPPGFPRSGPMIYPFQIVETDEMIVFLYETFGMIRRIYMDGRDPPEYLPPTLMGYSLGHWEGDELVIHTDHYAPGLLAGDGLRQYGDLSVDERYRLVDDGRGLMFGNPSRDGRRLMRAIRLTMADGTEKQLQ